MQPLLGETIGRLKDDSQHTADQLTTYLTSISKPTTVSEHFLYCNNHSANDIKLHSTRTVYEKLEKHTSSKTTDKTLEPFRYQ